MHAASRTSLSRSALHALAVARMHEAPLDVRNCHPIDDCSGPTAMDIAREIDQLQPDAVAPHASWSTPANRAVAEQGLRLAYAAASLPPPQRIIWCDGPLDIAKRLRALPAAIAPGASIKAEICDQPLKKTTVLAEVFWKELLFDTVKAGTRDRRIAEAMDRAVVEAVDERLCGFTARVHRLWRRLRGQGRLLPGGSFRNVALGPVEYAAASSFRRIHKVAGGDIETRRLHGLWMLADNAGWVVPYEHVCWISERPTELHVAPRGRLHNATGPALEYRDGYKFFAWNGVEVPAWAIEHPERVTVAALDDSFDPVLRRRLIEIMTPERLIASGAARRLSRDETGVLWGMSWQYRGTTIDKWKAVEIVGDALAPDGSRKHHIIPVPVDLRTAREAVAWALGPAPADHAPL